MQPEIIRPVQPAGKVVQRDQPGLPNQGPERSRTEQTDVPKTLVLFEESPIEAADVAIRQRNRQELGPVEFAVGVVGIPEVGGGQEDHSQRRQDSPDFLQESSLPGPSADQVLDDVEGRDEIEGPVGEGKVQPAALKVRGMSVGSCKLKDVAMVVRPEVAGAATRENAPEAAGSAADVEHAPILEIEQGGGLEIGQQLPVSLATLFPVADPALIGRAFPGPEDPLRHLLQGPLLACSLRIFFHFSPIAVNFGPKTVTNLSTYSTETG